MMNTSFASTAGVRRALNSIASMTIDYCISFGLFICAAYPSIALINPGHGVYGWEIGMHLKHVDILPSFTSNSFHCLHRDALPELFYSGSFDRMPTTLPSANLALDGKAAGKG